MENKKKLYVIISVVICALVMTWVDGVLLPPYAVKSVIKVVLFLLVPLAYFRIFPGEGCAVKKLFIPNRRTLAIAAVLGVGLYLFILGGYWVLTRFVDISQMVIDLTAGGGVTADNFLGVSLYISLCNSLLEEFLFRGYAFLTLKKLTNRSFAWWFSAVVFAAYHSGMVFGSGSLLVWGLMMAGLIVAGLFLNYINERSENLITSYLVHMFANFAINTIGFRIFGMI